MINNLIFTSTSIGLGIHKGKGFIKQHIVEGCVKRYAVALNRHPLIYLGKAEEERRGDKTWHATQL